MTKSTYLILATAGGVVGGWLGAFFDSGDQFGILGIVGATIGGLAAIIIGYQIAKRNGL